MKSFAALLAFVLSTPAFANMITVKDFPSALECEAPGARMPEVRKVSITKFDTEEPDSTFRMGLQETSWQGLTYDVSFSDECEGWYAVSFKIEDLTKLKLGLLTEVEGVLEYDDLGELFPGEPEENQHDLTKITCRVK